MDILTRNHRPSSCFDYKRSELQQFYSTRHAFLSSPSLFRTQSDGVTIDLSGETFGVRSDALVNAPLEPRLFVYRRDGSALELLRNDDAQEWCERLSRLSPSQQHQHQQQDRFGDATGLENAVDVREQECSSDPHSQATRQVNG